MDDDIIREFLVESHEGLDRLDRDFIALESNPSDHERLAAVFRTIHTIKGTSGFLGLGRLEALAHVGESLLAQLRDGTISLTPEMMHALLALVDRVREILRVLEATGREPERAHDDLAQRLSAAASSVASPDPAPITPQVAPADPAVVAATAEATEPSVADAYVRIDIGLLDKLMNLVGELVLARNQIVQVGARLEDSTFLGAAQRLDLVTTELQEHVMKTRMQPVGNVWSKLPRVVRDLAKMCGKQVRVEMLGKETELDRTIIDAIKDPLTHIVRNAVDHGIETPAKRAAAGKPKTGTLTLRAYHEGGQVNIEIADDGNGLDLEAIRAKALARGMLTPDRAARLGDRELGQLIFQAGFSTAERVTNVSGRGVGMDVVQTNIERIGGAVDVLTTRGVGTTIKIKIPLTLAIVPALVVGCGHERYAIPQANLLELVRVDDARTAVETVQGAPVYRLRGQLLPLVELARALDGAPSSVASAASDRPLCIIVLAADDRQFGLVVDEVHDTEEIVVKPLGKELQRVSLYAGATIMGDGRVALILDVLGLAEHAGISARARSRATGDAQEQAMPTGDGTKQTLLLFGVRDDAAMAVPLALVARLEELPATAVERVGHGQVVQYRGRLLPLVDLRETTGHESDALQIIVYSEGERSVGFVVTKILDVVEESLCIEPHASRAGIAGSAIVHGRATELLDVPGVIRQHVPWFFHGGVQ